MLKIEIPDFNPLKPVVFLDVDGVLNHTLYYQKLTQQGQKRIADKSQEFDPESLKILNEISDWNFVLSSAWRKHYPIEKINFYLTSGGFRGKVISYTPVINERWQVRGNEVLGWISENVKDSDGFRNSYVIFDDDSDFLLEQAKNFFHVDRYAGITPNHIYKAKRFLSINNKLEL